MCIHHWKIEDDKDWHQIGVCSKCGEQKDFGINPTIVTDRALITTEYFRYSQDRALLKVPRFQKRECRYYKSTDKMTSEQRESDLYAHDNWMPEEVEYLFQESDGLVYFYR